MNALHSSDARATVSQLNDDRRAAVNWLVNQLRWERTLELLRSTDDDHREQAA